VNNIGGQKFEIGRSRNGSVADRDVQLVRCDDPELGIAVLPPELVPDYRDIER
jgi:hypothetical protein